MVHNMVIPDITEDLGTYLLCDSDDEASEPGIEERDESDHEENDGVEGDESEEMVESEDELGPD